MEYRKDIDGMRAVAVLSVILFHAGLMPFGYLGVDVFFAISGFLITGIIHKESINGNFRIGNFYMRRIRRILPLVLTSTLVVLLIGYFFMLPNDLENISNSILATDFFSNNILEKITAKNYWATSNHFDPLMHTWSLGIEEQFYLFFPLIFFIKKDKKKIIPIIVMLLTITSIILYIKSNNSSSTFYFIQYRFFELSVGSLFALAFFEKKNSGRYKGITLLLLIALLAVPSTIINEKVRLIAVILAASLLLMPSHSSNKFIDITLSNPVLVWIGKISFSLYIWHQIVFAFARYHYFEHINISQSMLLILITFIVAFVSYFVIESPFRNKALFNSKKLLMAVFTLFLISVSISTLILSYGGIVRNVPELEFSIADRDSNHILGHHVTEKHIDYNKRIHQLDQPFKNNGKKKVLVIGNSFARDWCNVLLESNKSKDIDLSYIEQKDKNYPSFDKRIYEADVIFFSCAGKNDVRSLALKLKIDSNKIWNVGPKNFGVNNGLIYANRGKENYFTQTAPIDTAVLAQNDRLIKEWDKKYIDIIAVVKTNGNRVPVFTKENKFFSQDCIHLTQAGAIQLSKLLSLDAPLQ